MIDVYRNNTVTPVLQQNYTTSPELILEGQGGNDSITVDYSGGNPVPAAGLIVDGGSGTDNTITIVDSIGGHAITLASGGSVTDNGGQFGYTDFQELDLDLSAGANTLTASGNASVSATVMDLNLAGGSLAMASGSTLPTFTDMTVNHATFDLAGTSQTIDSLNGSGSVTDNGSAATLTVGQQNGGGNLTGSITNGSGVLSLTKNGSGTLTLSGSNSYTGVTLINDGVIASGNSASLAGLSGAVEFNGGTFHVTANTISANVNVKYTTSFTGATGASTGTFDIDPGVTLTIGTIGGSACLRTNGGGAHGGDFTVTGGGTLKILSNNGQQDNALNLAEGTIDLEAATGLGGGDSGVVLDAHDGTTLILKQDASTNFLTPIDLVDAAATFNLMVDRVTAGAGVTQSLNSFTSAAHLRSTSAPARISAAASPVSRSARSRWAATARSMSARILF